MGWGGWVEGVCWVVIGKIRRKGSYMFVWLVEKEWGGGEG